MKILKNPIFMFILGGICFYSISVFAEYVVSADKVEYSSNVSVKDKIDDLYTRVKPVYNGNTEVTPTKNNQTLLTNGKILNSNITINKIPDKFVDISDSTLTSSNELMNGKVAYKADGTKIVGSVSVNDCISGTYNHKANTQWQIQLSFSPTFYLLKLSHNMQGQVVLFYENTTNKTYRYNTYNDTTEDWSRYIEYNGNSIHTLDTVPTSWSWYTDQFDIKYIACK